MTTFPEAPNASVETKDEGSENLLKVIEASMVSLDTYEVFLCCKDPVLKGFRSPIVLGGSKRET